IYLKTSTERGRYNEPGRYKYDGIPMDSLIATAARALAAGDPLGALKRVALRDDAPAKALDTARATLEAHADRANAAHARYLEVRRLLLIVRIDEAERTLAELDPAPLSPASRTAHELVVAGIAIRRLRTKAARAALARARRVAHQARIPALTAEVESASLVLHTPAARPIARERGASPPARGGRSVAGVESVCRGRVPSCRAPCKHGGLARKAPGVVRARTRTGRSEARRRAQGYARGAGIRSEARQ